MSFHQSSNNSGIVNMGGTNSFTNTTFGDQAETIVTSDSAQPSQAQNLLAPSEPDGRKDIGIVTILPVETRAVIDELGLDRPRKREGLFFSTGKVPTDSGTANVVRSEEHTSELQSRFDLVCRLLLEKKKNRTKTAQTTTTQS